MLEGFTSMRYRHSVLQPSIAHTDALVAAARNGNRQAFAELVRLHRPRVFALALHLTANRADADDITQDVFIKALGRIHEFEGRSALFTWLYRITLNRALNFGRDARRRGTVDLNDDRVVFAVAVDAESNPRLALELKEAYAVLVHALDALSPVLRSTVALVALQGLSHREAAVVLQTNEGTVAWRIHEARDQIRKHIERLTRDPTPLPVSARRHQAADDLRGILAALGGPTLGTSGPVGEPTY